jgi:DNA modification methylase
MEKINQHTIVNGDGKIIPVENVSQGGRYPTDIIYFKTAESETEKKVWHGTQKPVGLMEYLIKTYSNPNDTILDNTMGVGTTGVACVNTGRIFYGIEKDSVFFNIAKERIIGRTNQCV